MVEWEDRSAAMVAKIVGILAGIAIFAVYFALIGTRPVLESVLGVTLALVGGYWAFREVVRRLDRSREKPE